MSVRGEYVSVRDHSLDIPSKSWALVDVRVHQVQ